MNTYEGAAGEIDIDYFQMTRNNNQVKDKYKARINKCKKCQMNLKDTLKGSTLTDGALYGCDTAVLGKYIWEDNKENQKQQDDKHLIVLRNAAKTIKSVFKLTMT